MTAKMINNLIHEDFNQARLKASWRDWLSRLTRRSNDMLSYDEVSRGLPFRNRHYRGLQTVPLDEIVGSESQSRDFDRAFYPRYVRSRGRWTNVDRAYYEDVPLPPVELIKIGQMYFIRDGKHRVSVARTRGQAFIDALVTEVELAEPGDLPARKLNHNRAIH